jgi:hypothetical protein
MQRESQRASGSHSAARARLALLLLVHCDSIASTSRYGHRGCRIIVVLANELGTASA